MNKLRYRLTLTYIILIGVAFISLAFFLTNLIERAYIDAVGNRLAKEANFIIKQIERDNSIITEESNLLNQLVKDYSKELNIRITIIDMKGNVLADTDYYYLEMDNHGSRPEIVDAVSGKIGKEIRYSNSLGMEMLYIAIPIKGEFSGVVRLSIPSKEISTSIETIWYSLIFGLVFLFIIIIVISNKMAYMITLPIENITKIAKKITNGDYSARALIKSQDEIGQLAVALNQMANSLKKQIDVIHESERNLSTVLNNMAHGVILIDQQGIIKLANPAIEWLLGDSIVDIVGKYHMEAGENDSLSELIERSLKTGESLHTEIAIKYPVRKFLATNLAPIIDENGKVNGVVAVLNDITKLKRLENMRTSFVANVSHELRTPVTAIKGFTETLLDGELEDEETSKAFLQIIYKESDRLHRLINDLLDLSKIELNQDILNYSKVNVKKLMESVIETFRPQIVKRGLAIEEKLSEVTADLDEDRIKQVMINLINNALTYTTKGKITIYLVDQEDYVKIIVRDTGIGIPKNEIARIFERFYRVDKARSRDSGGTGLGLAIVKHIIESHQGFIQVESEVGVGTSFTIIIPKHKTSKKY